VPATQEIALPISGKKAVLRRATGRDMVEADRLAGRDAGDYTVRMAMLSRLASVDGRVLPFEDFQDLDMEDITAMMSLDFPTEPKAGPPGMPPSASSPSAASPDGPFPTS
jgi:hypothetical protein